MKFFIRVLAVTVFVVSVAWFCKQRGYEPAIGVFTSLSTFISTFAPQKQSNKDAQQNQVVSDNAFGVQASGNVNIGNFGHTQNKSRGDVNTGNLGHAESNKHNAE